jgi:hypothetical protein
MIRRGDDAPGWGELYFSKIYTPDVHASRSEYTRERIRNRELDQVFVVPPEPLRLLATTSPGPISGRTVAAANTALWRVEVFNQLVLGQTMFNAGIAAELKARSTSDGRLEDLGTAAAAMSAMVHADGIGAAQAPGGWYRELKEAIAANIDDLESRMSLPRRYFEERLFVVFDFVVLALVIVAAVSS